MLSTTVEGILERSDQVALLDMVKRSVALGLSGAPPQVPIIDYHTPALRRQCASIVTLRQNGQVIGYAGTIEPKAALISDVCHNAYEAAKHGAKRSCDRQALTVEVCVVHAVDCLNARSFDRVCDQLRVGEHGVLLHHSAGAATLTPDKWNETPEPYEFLHQLCDKAGVASGDWPDDMHVTVYRVESLPQVEILDFGDERPNKPR